MKYTRVAGKNYDDALETLEAIKKAFVVVSIEYEWDTIYHIHVFHIYYTDRDLWR